MVSNTIKLNIPHSSAERVTQQWVQDTLRQFNSGDLSLNQTRDLILGYFTAPGERLHPTSDINDLDEVCRELGIQNSEVTPAEAVRELNAEIERLRAAVGTSPVTK